MIAKTESVAVVGMDGHPVDVEVAVAQGLPVAHETEEAANNWRQQFEERNQQWDKWDEEDKEGRKKS